MAQAPRALLAAKRRSPRSRPFEDSLDAKCKLAQAGKPCKSYEKLLKHEKLDSSRMLKATPGCSDAKLASKGFAKERFCRSR